MDLSSEGFEFNANVWNWKATLEVIKSLDLISESKLRHMSSNATGVKVDASEAHLIGEAVRERILPKLAPDKRIYADLTVTDKPDDMTLHKDEDDQWKNYSVGHDWLKEFSDFCVQSKGFQVF
ncbi:MAG: hypothetical protein LC734_01830 [Acidobacteria bacterium]|nr:hypothetical protein [Acidobacteriota bacterium]